MDTTAPRPLITSTALLSTRSRCLQRHSRFPIHTAGRDPLHRHHGKTLNVDQNSSSAPSQTLAMDKLGLVTKLMEQYIPSRNTEVSRPPALKSSADAPDGSIQLDTFASSTWFSLPLSEKVLSQWFLRTLFNRACAYSARGINCASSDFRSHCLHNDSRTSFLEHSLRTIIVIRARARLSVLVRYCAPSSREHKEGSQ